MIPPNSVRVDTNWAASSRFQHENSDLKQTVESIVHHILSTTSIHRRDRLWPADLLVYSTNPLSFAFGACGTSLLVHDVLQSLPGDVSSWLRGRRIEGDTYPPGLYMGLAGIAYSFCELGWIDEAEDALRRVYTSPLRFSDPTMFLGAAGWGLVSISLQQRTGKWSYIDRAIEAGNYIVKSANATEYGHCWEDPASARIGFARGASGIALFLLRLYQASADVKYLRHALSGLEFDIAHARGDERRLRWPPSCNAARTIPFWQAGTSGVGSTLIRFARALMDDRLARLSVAAAEGAHVPLAPSASQFDGLSGIGEFLLDMYLFTGDDEYWSRSLDVAKSIVCYQIRRTEGIAFAGRGQQRICTDYGYGSAGVGLFLRRLITLGSRRLHDL